MSDGLQREVAELERLVGPHQAREMHSMTVAALAHFTPNAKVDAVIGDTAVSTTITIPSSDLEVIGFFGNFKNFDLSFATIHLLEL